MRRTVEAAIELGISYLTLYGFSSENWKRPAGEVHDLMGLLRHYLRAEIAELHRNGVRLRIIGDRKRLSAEIITLIENGERLTQDNDRLNLTIALSYGGRAEIALGGAPARRVWSRPGIFRPTRSTKTPWPASFSPSTCPTPTSSSAPAANSASAISCLWQSAYAELVFVDTYWPDFGKADLERAISDFCGRERRYGATVESR